MEKFVPSIILPEFSINTVYMQHCISRKKLEELSYAYIQINRKNQYYKWMIEHPILSRIPFVKQYIRKKIGL